jgi:hypothetical protein
MEAKKFVEALKTECRDAAVQGCVESYISPPGRKPAQSLVELSQWFIALSAHDREMVIRAMADAADYTLFGVLAVLDGARSIEGEGEKSVFHLSAHKEGKQSVISPGPYDLHDL